MPRILTDDEIARAKAAGITDPTAEDIDFLNVDPEGDEAKLEAQLPGSASAISVQELAAQIAAMADEAKANASHADLLSIIQKIGAVALKFLP